MEINGSVAIKNIIDEIDGNIGKRWPRGLRLTVYDKILEIK